MDGNQLTIRQQEDNDYGREKVESGNDLYTGRLAAEERRAESPADLPEHNVQIRDERSDGPFI